MLISEAGKQCYGETSPLAKFYLLLLMVHLGINLLATFEHLECLKQHSMYISLMDGFSR